MIDLGKYPVLGVQVNAIDYEAAVARTIQAAEASKPFSVTALAVHGIMEGSFSPHMRTRMKAHDIVCPDGQPVRWALRLLHGKSLPERVYGPTLMLHICAAAAKRGLPIFLYGSSDEVLESLVVKLHQRFPSLLIAGKRAGLYERVTPEERDRRLQEIRESGARITFIGLGCPRQDVWAYENKSALSMPVISVGAAFDFHAGTRAQAPGIMQRYGFEWLFRLSQEPRRLWKRYVLLNPKYVVYLVRQMLGARDFPENTDPPTEQRYA